MNSHDRLTNCLGYLAASCVALGVSPIPTLHAEPNGFGFSGPEIFPVESQIHQLSEGDFDNDGLLDLVVVNNMRSKITFLYNRGDEQEEDSEGETEPITADNINYLPPDARFRIESIASEKRIASLAVADLNHDNLPDLAYYGEPPRELLVQYNEDGKGWSLPKKFLIEDGQMNQNALVSGDLNNDGREDLVILGENQLYWLVQDEKLGLLEPRKIPFTGTVKAVQVIDVDGDARKDLLFINWEDASPFRVRFQNERGELGPELYFDFASIRSFMADDLNQDQKPELVTIALNSGRAQLSRFTQKAAEPLVGSFSRGQLNLFPLARTSKDQRGMLWADFNKDGFLDLLYSQPENGQVSIVFQNPDGQFQAPTTFPFLTGVTSLAAADWNNDNVPEIFVLSSDERRVAVTRLTKEGRLPFPDALPLQGRPLGLAPGNLSADPENASLAVVMDVDGRRHLHLLGPEGERHHQLLDEDFRSNPSGMMLHDVDQDGLQDLVLLIPYQKIKILLNRGDEDFLELDVSAPGGVMDEPWASQADVDGDGEPELLLGQQNFVRAVVLKRQDSAEDTSNSDTWLFDVKEQINGASGNSRIVGAAALQSEDESNNALFLLDRARQVLSVCQRNEAGVWEVVRNLPLPVADFRSLLPLGVGSKKPNSLVLAGLQQVAWMQFAGETWALEESGGYESNLKDAFLLDVIPGDLNGDGTKELVFLETGKNNVEIVTYQPPSELKLAIRWQVFERRSFQSGRGGMPEPREAVIADFTGDGRQDLAVLVHDRVLLYPADSKE